MSEFLRYSIVFQIIASCTQDTLPQNVKDMLHAAPNKAAHMNIVSDLMVKKKGRWEVDLTKPRFQMQTARSDEDKNAYKHKGRARLLVEAEMPGGVVASITFLRVLVS